MRIERNVGILDIVDSVESDPMITPEARVVALAEKVRSFGRNNDYTTPAIEFADRLESTALELLNDPTRNVSLAVTGPQNIAQTIIGILVHPGNASFLRAPAPAGTMMQVYHPIISAPGLYVEATISPPPEHSARHNLKCEYTVVSHHHLPQRRAA